MAITSYNNSVCLETVVNMFGIDPLKFNCIQPVCIDYNDHGCESYWTQYFENGNLVSREELAAELYRAEIEVAAYLGQFPFETYIENEEIDIERCYRNEKVMGVPINNYIFETKWNCIQEFGTFEQTKIGVGTVNYIDNDGDGYKELAEITFDYSAVTVEFSADDVLLMFQGFYNYNNLICPILSISIDDINKIMVFSVNSWNMVKPELYIHRKFVEYKALDACNSDIYINEVDINIMTKTCGPDGWMYFDSNQDCSGAGCEETKYPFCVSPVENRQGYFKINTGKIDSETGCFIEGAERGQFTNPKRIEINYISSCNDCYKKTNTAFCNLIERAIIYIALSRLPRTLCECGCSSEYLEELKYDSSITYANSKTKFNYPFELIRGNPFGTKLGEIEGHKILKNLVDDLC